MTTQLYYVDQDQADDPEGSSHQLLTAAEIARAFPAFAPLITGDGTESLDYTHELWRVRIVAAGEHDCRYAGESGAGPVAFCEECA
jgi:hypothetical protein